MTPFSVTASSIALSATYVDGVVLRANAGGAMADVLPGSDIGALPSGAVVTVKNEDASALYQITPGVNASLDHSATGFRVLGPGQSAAFVSDGAGYHSLHGPTRVKFAPASAPILYVAPNGSDLNSGISASRAFQTIQAAMNSLFQGYDHGGAKFTMQLAPGTYAGFSIRGGFSGHYGNPAIINPPTFTLRGDPAAAASYVIDGGAADAINVTLGKSLHVDGVMLKSSSGYGASCLLSGGEIVLHTVVFGDCAGGMVFANACANMWQQGPWTIAGNGQFLIYMDQGAVFTATPNPSPTTITAQGIRSFSDFVVGSGRGSAVNLNGVSFVVPPGSSVTGAKWATKLYGTIDSPYSTADLNTIIFGSANGVAR